MKINYTFLFTLFVLITCTLNAQDCSVSVPIPYYQDFQSQTTTALPACYVNETLAPGIPIPPNNEWQTYNLGNGEKYAKLNIVPDNYDKHGNSWMYLPKMYFYAGSSYKLSFLYKSSTTLFPGAPILKIAYGTCQNSTCMTTVLTQTGINNTAFQSGVLNFSVATSGNYYLGFNDQDYQNFPGQWIAIDSIVVQDFSTVPVKMSSLNYSRLNNIANLFFQTFSEQNNKGFEIEQSIDGRQFQRIDFIASKAVNGNSTNPIAYEYNIPINRLNAGSIYRLKQLDKNGGMAYSNIVNIAIFPVKPSVVTLNGNPVYGSLNYTIYYQQANSFSIKIIDITGRTVIRNNVLVNSGYTPLVQNVQTLPVGKYFLTVTNMQGQSLQKPIAFNKQ